MKYCCVPFCESKSSNPTKRLSNTKISFHEFPCDEIVRLQWLRRIARKDFIINDKSNSSVVCSKHFTQYDYKPTSTNKRTLLKKGAIPTVFPMYPSYALLPPPNNYLSLVSSNDVKKPSIVKDKTKNSRKRAVAFKSDLNSTDNKLQEKHEDRVFTIKKVKKDTSEASNSRLLISLNNVKKLDDETQNSTKKDSVDITVNSDMISPTNYSLEQLRENCAFMKGTQNSISKGNIEIGVNSDMTSTNNNLVEHQHKDRVLTIKKSMKDPPAANKNRSLLSINHVKRVSMAKTVTENLIKKSSADIAFNSDISSTNENLEFQQQKRHINTNKLAKKDTLAANTSCSLVSLNHVIKRSMVEDEIQNSTQKSSIDIAVNSELASTNNNLVKLQHNDRVFTIKNATKVTANNNSSPVILIYVKKPSMVGTVTENPTKILPADFNSDASPTNNNLVEQRHEDSVFTIKKAKTDPKAANNHSYGTLNHVKGLALETVTENSAKIVPVDTAFYSVMASTNNNLREQQHEDLACTIKYAKKDLYAGNINRSCVSLNHAKRPSSVETVTENSIKIVPADTTVNSNTTSTNNNLQELQHEDIKNANKDPAAANMNNSCISLNHTKKPSMATSINNSIKFVLQTKVTDQQKEITRLRGLLCAKKRRWKIVKEEMDMLKKKVSFYEKNGHYEILRKAQLILKENYPQANFIGDQLENFLKKRPKWKESTIRECASWVACSPKGYDFVRERKLMVLPCRSTLKKYVATSKLQSQKTDTCHLDPCLVGSLKKPAQKN